MFVQKRCKFGDVCVDLSKSDLYFGREGVVAVDVGAKVCVVVCEVEFLCSLSVVVLECEEVVGGEKVLAVELTCLFAAKNRYGSCFAWL